MISWIIFQIVITAILLVLFAKLAASRWWIRWPIALVGIGLCLWLILWALDLGGGFHEIFIGRCNEFRC